MFVCLLTTLQDNVKCGETQFLEGDKCVYACTSKIYTVQNQEKVCTSYCENNFYHYVNNHMQCAQQCQDNEVMEIDRFVHLQMHRCVNSCSAINKYKYQRQCVSDCGTLHIHEDKCVTLCTALQLYVDKNSNKCVNNCSLKHQVGLETFCVEACPDSAPKIFSGVCVHSCREYGGFLINGTSNCVVYCDNKTEILYNNESYCIDNCNTFYNELKCVSSCKALNNQNVIMTPTYSYCNQSCSKEYPIRIEQNTSNETYCTSSCMGKFPYYHTQLQKCVASCSQYDLKIDTNGSCNAKCGVHDDVIVEHGETQCHRKCLGYYLDGVCVTSCLKEPGKRLIFVSNELDRDCVDKCGDNQYYLDNITEVYCTDQCHGRVALYKGLNFCLNLCRDKNLHYNKISGHCEQCDPTQYITENNGDLECAIECGGVTPFYGTDQLCLASCFENDMVLLSLESKICGQKCDSPHVTFNEDFKEYICADSCTTEYYSQIKIKNEIYKVCQQQCYQNQSIQDKRCVNPDETCNDGKVKFELQCVDKCPETHEVVNQICLPRCQDDSDLDYLVLNDQYQCISHTLFYKNVNLVKVHQDYSNCSLYWEADQLNYECSASDQIGCLNLSQKYYAQPLNKQCIDNCRKFNLALNKTINSCVANCDANHQKVHVQNETICQQKELCIFYDDLNQEFIDFCYSFVRNNKEMSDKTGQIVYSCISACNQKEIKIKRPFNQYLMFFECADKCPDNQYYNQTNQSCESKCNYYDKDYTTCQEKSQCTYFLNDTSNNQHRVICVDACPPNHYINKTNSFCVDKKGEMAGWAVPLTLGLAIVSAIVIGCIVMSIKKRIRMQQEGNETGDKKPNEKKATKTDKKKKRYQSLHQVKQDNLDGDVIADEEEDLKIKIANEKYSLKLDDEFM